MFIYLLIIKIHMIEIDLICRSTMNMPIIRLIIEMTSLHGPVIKIYEISWQHRNACEI